MFLIVLLRFVFIVVRSRFYYVIFFGNEGERGWAGSNLIMEFKGKDKYDEYVKYVFFNVKKGEKLKFEKFYREYLNR